MVYYVLFGLFFFGLGYFLAGRNRRKVSGAQASAILLGAFVLGSLSAVIFRSYGIADAMAKGGILTLDIALMLGGAALRSKSLEKKV